MLYVEWKKHVKENEEPVLIQCFVQANFNHCPLVWFFTSPESLWKSERIQDRIFRILFGDFVRKNRKTTLLFKQHKNLAIEIFKTLKNLNPDYMREIFTKNENSCRLRDNSRHEMI